MKGPAHHRWSPAGGGGGYREDGDHLHRLVHLAGNCVDWSSIRKRWPSRTLPAGVPWPPHNLTERCRLSDRVTCSRVTDRRPGVSLAAGVPVRRDPAFLLPSGTRRCKTACPWAWLAAPAKPPARNIRNRLVPALRLTGGRKGAPEDKFFHGPGKLPSEILSRPFSPMNLVGKAGRRSMPLRRVCWDGFMQARFSVNRNAGPAPGPRPGHSLCSVQQGSGRQRAACSNRLCRGLVDESGFPVTRCITKIPGGVSINCHRFHAPGIGIGRFAFSNNRQACEETGGNV